MNRQDVFPGSLFSAVCVRTKTTISTARQASMRRRLSAVLHSIVTQRTERQVNEYADEYTIVTFRRSFNSYAVWNH